MDRQYLDYDAELDARDALIEQKDNLLRALAAKVDELGTVILQSNQVIAETAASLEATRAKADDDANAANEIIASLQGQVAQLEEQLKTNREDIGTTIAALSNELKNARAAAARELASVKEEAELRQQAVDQEWQALLRAAAEREDSLRQEILHLKAGKHTQSEDFRSILTSSVGDQQKQYEELRQAFVEAQRSAEQRALNAETRAEELRQALAMAVGDIERAREAARAGIEEVHSMAVSDAQQKEAALRMSVEEVEQAMQERHRRELGALQLAHEQELARLATTKIAPLQDKLQAATDRAMLAEAALDASVAKHTEELVEVGASLEAQQAVFESQLAQLSERCRAAIAQTVGALEGALSRSKDEHMEEVGALKAALQKVQESAKEFGVASTTTTGLSAGARGPAAASALPGISPKKRESLGGSLLFPAPGSSSASSSAHGVPRRSSVTSVGSSSSNGSAHEPRQQAQLQQPRRSSLTGSITNAADAADAARAAAGHVLHKGDDQAIGVHFDSDAAVAGSSAVERLRESYDRKLEAQRGAHEREMAGLRKEMEALASLVANGGSSNNNSNSSGGQEKEQDPTAKAGARVARASLAAAGILPPPPPPPSSAPPARSGPRASMAMGMGSTLAAIKENEAVTSETASTRQRMPRASRASMAMKSLSDLAGATPAAASSSASSRNARASAVGLAALGQAHSAAALGQLQAELETMRMQRDAAVSTRDEMEKEKEEADQKAAAAEAEKARIASELAAVRSQLAAAHGDAKAAKDMAATAEQQASLAKSFNESALHSARAHAERLELQLVEAQEEASRASAELQRTQAALALARDEADEAYEQVEELREQVRLTSEERMLAFTELSSGQKSAIESLREGFNEQIEMVRQASDAKLEMTISALRHAHGAEIESRDARIDAMEDEIDRHKEDLQRARQDERRAASEASALKRQLEPLQKDVEALQSRLKAEEEACDEAEEACARLVSELSDFVGEQAAAAIKEGKAAPSSASSVSKGDGGAGLVASKVAEINRELDQAHEGKEKAEAELAKQRAYYEGTLAALTDSNTREVQALQLALREARAAAASAASSSNGTTAAPASASFSSASHTLMASPHHPLSARGRAGALLGLTLDLPYQNNGVARSLSSPPAPTHNHAASDDGAGGALADGLALLGLKPTSASSASPQATPSQLRPQGGAFVKPTPRRLAGDSSSSSSSLFSPGSTGGSEALASLQKELALLGLGPAGSGQQPADETAAGTPAKGSSSSIFAALFDSIEFPSARSDATDGEDAGRVEGWQQSLLKRLHALEMALARVALDAGAPAIPADDADKEAEARAEAEEEAEAAASPSKGRREDAWTDEDDAGKNLPRLAESGSAPSAKAYLSSPPSKPKADAAPSSALARHKKQQENWRRKFRRAFIRVGRIAESLATRLQGVKSKEQDLLRKQANDVTRSLTAAQLERAREIDRLEAALVHAKRAEAMSVGAPSMNASAANSPSPRAMSPLTYTAVSPGSFSYASSSYPHPHGHGNNAGGHPALSSAQLTETVAKLKAAHASDIEALKQQQQGLESSLSSVRLELESRKEELLSMQLKAQGDRDVWEQERTQLEEEVEHLHDTTRRQLELAREADARAQQLIQEAHQQARAEADSAIKRALDRQELEIDRLKQAHAGEVQFLQERVATLTGELDEVRRRLLQELAQHHSEIKTTAEAKQKEHDEALKRALERCESSLQAAHSEELSRVKQAHETAIEGLKAAHAHKVALILHDAERSEMASRASYDQQLGHLQQSLNEANTALKAAESKADELGRKCADLDKRFALEAARRTAAERELSTARADARREVDRREYIQSSTTRTEADLRRQIAAAKEETAAAVSRGKAVERQLEAMLAERVKGSGGSGSGYNTPNASGMSAVSALDKEEIARLRGRVSDLTATVAELQAHLAGVQAQLQVVREEASEATASSQGLRLQLAVMEEELFRTREREESLAKASGLVGSLKAQSAVEIAKAKKQLLQQQQQESSPDRPHEGQGGNDDNAASEGSGLVLADTLDGLASPSSPDALPAPSAAYRQYSTPFSSAGVPRMDISQASLLPSAAAQNASSRGTAALAAAGDASRAAADAAKPAPPANSHASVASHQQQAAASLAAVASANTPSFTAIFRDRARAHSAQRRR